MSVREDEARLAWALSEALDQFSSFLWARYGKDFVELAEGENEKEALEEKSEVTC